MSSMHEALGSISNRIKKKKKGREEWRKGGKEEGGLRGRARERAGEKTAHFHSRVRKCPCERREEEF